MQPINWNELRDFLAVARVGQYARAAATLGIDPATIGRRLRRLERALGYTLFEQTREGQVLTEAGERLLAQVELMGQAFETIVEQQSPAGLSGHLRISVSEGFGTWFIARHLQGFTDRYPLLTVDLAATSGFLNPSKREADMAILLARPRTGPVISGKLSDYRLQLYAGRSYLARKGGPQNLDDLALRHRLIGYVPDLLYAPELRYLGEIDERLNAHIRSSSINAQHQLVAAGAGIAVLPCFIGDADPRLERVLPEIGIDRSFWIVIHRDTRQLQRVRAFRNWLLEVVAQNRDALLGRIP
ncbi:MAG: LysR family transcriptional regulator [Novosphingobium sp.]|nr:LysR family transcriptional regulator [Novosphingobium sp.]